MTAESFNLTAPTPVIRTGVKARTLRPTRAEDARVPGPSRPNLAQAQDHEPTTAEGYLATHWAGEGHATRAAQDVMGFPARLLGQLPDPGEGGAPWTIGCVIGDQYVAFTTDLDVQRRCGEKRPWFDAAEWVAAVAAVEGGYVGPDTLSGWCAEKTRYRRGSRWVLTMEYALQGRVAEDADRGWLVWQVLYDLDPALRVKVVI